MITTLFRLGAFLALALTLQLSRAQSFDFPPGFKTTEITTNGTTIHVRYAGTGPAVVLIHGYGETGDMWAPMARDLVRDHTVVVPRPARTRPLFEAVGRHRQEDAGG